MIPDYVIVFAASCFVALGWLAFAACFVRPTAHDLAPVDFDRSADQAIDVVSS